jgi:hypothetical protein
MTFIVWLHSLALLLLNLSLLAWVKLRWPDSSFGKILAVIA